MVINKEVINKILGEKMNPTILLVDDEKDVCSALNRTFRRNNFKVFEANSGEQALDVLANNNIDVIVSDQRMPEMTGTQFFSVVKNLYPNVGRIILSGHSDIEDLQEAINEANIYRFLPKPWDEKQLLETVNSAIPQAISISKRFHSSERQLIRSYDQPTVDAATEQKKQALSKAIKTNSLLLEEQSYDSFNDKSPLTYLNVFWPDFASIKHASIVDLVNDSEECQILFSWYLLSVIKHMEKYEGGERVFVIDLFYEGFAREPSLLNALEDVLIKQPKTIFRLSFESLMENDFTCFLTENGYYKSSVILDVGEKIINVSQLKDTPILYLEMNCKNNAINNHSLTEKRLKMIAEAKIIGVNVVLSNDQLQSQQNYAKSIGVDFF